MPGAEFKTDNFGNTLAVIDGKPYYLNKPGMSAQDTLKMAFTIVNFLGIGKMYGIGKQGVGLLSNIGRSGATGTTLSVAEDVVAKMVGSEQKGLLGTGIDPVKALTTGALTSVFQAGGDILISAIPTIARNLKNINTLDMLRYQYMMVKNTINSLQIHLVLMLFSLLY